MIRLFALVAALMFAVFAAALPISWVDFSRSGVALGSTSIPTIPALAAIGGAAIVVAMAVCGVLWQWLQTPGWLRWSLGGVFLVTACSVAGGWWGYFVPGELTAYLYRPTVSSFLLAISAVAAAAAAPRSGRAIAEGITGCFQRGRLPLVILVLAMLMVGSAAAAQYLLDGIPHTPDAIIYLMQGRGYWNGCLAMDAPMYPKFFGGGYFFEVGDAGFYGKYPPMWPTVLGAFDRLSASWLAAPVVAVGIVLVTYRYARARDEADFSWLVAAMVALSPWLWLNSLTQLSHLMATFWLVLFVDLRARWASSRRFGTGLLAGLALGGAIVTRPQDALFFSAPILLWMTWEVLTNWRLFLPSLAFLPGMLLGSGIFLGLNRYLTGQAGKSPYGQGILSQLLSQSPSTPLEALVWTHEGWVNWSQEVYGRVIPGAVIVIVALLFARRYLRQGWELAAGGVSLLLAYTAFVFIYPVWVGPRWLVPLLPGTAFLLAGGIARARQLAQQEDRSLAGWAQGYLAFVGWGLLIAWLIAVPARLVEIKYDPPQAITGGVVEAIQTAVREEGLDNAVLGLPPETRPGGQPHCKSIRAGLTAMTVPFDESPVITIRATEYKLGEDKSIGWIEAARQAYPDRRLYYMNEEVGDFRIRPVEEQPKDGSESPR